MTRQKVKVTSYVTLWILIKVTHQFYSVWVRPEEVIVKELLPHCKKKYSSKNVTEVKVFQ